MDDTDLTLETVEKWTVAAMKNFLRKRGLQLTGAKKVLTARVYVAWELNIPLLPTPEEVSRQKKEHMERLLSTLEGKMPHPDSLSNGWLDEDQGMSLWPPTMIQDIAVFLDRHSPARQHGFTERLLSDYKEQKAFSYFASNFILELMYHPITDKSKFCYLRAKVSPSQRVTSNPHNTWILINKDTGAIESACCSCFAGLGSTCNHMAAVLLKVDFCWQHGYIKAPVTSASCVWKQPGKQSLIVTPQQVKDMEIVKPTIGRTEPKSSFHTATRTEFIPHKPEKGMSYEGFLERLGQVRPAAVVLGEQEENRYHLYQKWDEEKRGVIITVPPGIMELCANARTSEEVMSKLNAPLASSDVDNIEQATRGQSDSREWSVQRQGRITSSVFKDVHTRLKSGNNPDSLVDSVLGARSVPQYLPAIKYGHRMEAVAAKKYEDIMRNRRHSKLKVDICGLFVLSDIQYLGASPDRLVQCNCCGQGLLEIKCPYSCAGIAPSPDTVDYLEESDNLVTLKKNHKYYFQVQGQLAITGRDFCDFFIFSQQGYYLERIVRDRLFWDNLLKDLQSFYLLNIATRIAEIVRNTEDRQ